MATPGQIKAYNLFRSVCTRLRVPKTVLRHRTLAGTLSIPSSTGNRLWTGDPRTTDETTTDYLVWAIWKLREPRSNPQDDITPGRTVVGFTVAQICTIDDNFNPVPLADEDWLIDSLGQRWRLENPIPSPDGGWWYVEMELQR